MRILLLSLMLVCAAWAQTPEETRKAKIAGVSYPHLAEAARVQGDVRLRVESGIVSVLSGHPLLVTTAVESAKRLLPPEGPKDIELIYHFLIVDTVTSVTTPVTVKRGNAFERTVLRMFGLKTEKTVLETRCESGTARPTEVSIAGAFIEVRVYGRALCLMVETASVAD